MKVFEFPLIKTTLFFIIGIFLYPYLDLTFVSVISILSALLLLTFFFVLKNSKSKKSSFLILFSSLFLGICISTFHDKKKDKNNFIYSKKTNYTNEIVVQLTERLKSNKNVNRYICKIETIDSQHFTGKVLLSIKNQNKIPLFDDGCYLKFVSKIELLKDIPNAGQQFDYKKYLENKSIYGQIFLFNQEIHYSEPVGFSIKNTASKIRNNIIEKLKKNGFNQEELYVFAALLLGQQQDIDKEIIKDYQYAGAIHVLSVSGLHVGLLMSFLTILLSPLPNSKRVNFLKLIIILFSLSFFGVLAGLSPSVLRSVTMFSFVAVGLHLKRSVNFYNTLLISAFILLLFNPSYLFDVGFQLSYAALFFIVWLQPILSQLFEPKNKIVKYFWDIITVSTAAQIGTMPLSLYYFHQFTGLFFITNCVILPLITLIMGLGILVIIMSICNYFWQPILFLMEKTIWLINTIIHHIASFEQFIIKEVPLTKMLMILLYFILICWILLFKKPSFQRIVYSLCSILLFQLMIFKNNFDIDTESEFIVFSKPRSSLFIERFGHDVKVMSNEDESQNTALSNYYSTYFCKTKQQEKMQNLYQFHDKKIVVIDSSCVFLPSTNPDVLILIQSPKINLDKILETCKPKQIVADRSNYLSFIKLWETTCKKQKIPFHAVAEKGYFAVK